MQPHHQHNDQTRQRILEAAERLFARKDFSAVTVREITAAANCNLGAVNYHFGSKKNLYLEVFRRRWVPRAQRISARLEELARRRPPASPEEVVRTLCRAFFGSFQSEEEARLHHRLLGRELGNPSGAFDLVLKEAIRPTIELLVILLEPFLPHSGDRQRLLLDIFSVLGQVIYFNMARLPISRVVGQGYDSEFVERLIEHLTHFSLYGLLGRPREETR